MKPGLPNSVTTAFACLPRHSSITEPTHQSSEMTPPFHKRGSAGPEQNQALPSVTQRVGGRQGQTPIISWSPRPRATVPQALPPHWNEDDSCHVSLPIVGRWLGTWP